MNDRKGFAVMLASTAALVMLVIIILSGASGVSAQVPAILP